MRVEIVVWGVEFDQFRHHRLPNMFSYPMNPIWSVSPNRMDLDMHCVIVCVNYLNKSAAHDCHEDHSNVNAINETGKVSRRVRGVQEFTRRYPGIPRVVQSFWISLPVHRHFDLSRDVTSISFQEQIQLPSHLKKDLDCLFFCYLDICWSSKHNENHDRGFYTESDKLLYWP